MIDWTVVVTAGLSGLFGLLVATVPKWSAARMKRRENGALAARHFQIKQLDVEAEARVSLWENQKDELARLRGRVEELEAGRESAAQDAIALHRALSTIQELNQHLDEVAEEVTRLHKLIGERTNADDLAKLAMEVLYTVRRGRAIGGAA